MNVRQTLAGSTCMCRIRPHFSAAPRQLIHHCKRAKSPPKKTQQNNGSFHLLRTRALTGPETQVGSTLLPHPSPASHPSAAHPPPLSIHRTSTPAQPPSTMEPAQSSPVFRAYSCLAYPHSPVWIHRHPQTQSVINMLSSELCLQGWARTPKVSSGQ